MIIDYPVFLLLLLASRPVHLEFIRPENGIKKDAVKDGDNLDVASSLSTMKGDAEFEEKQNGGFEIRDSCLSGDTYCQTLRDKYEDLLKTIDNYAQRYVSLFLISTNLKDYDVEDSKEIITTDVELYISGQDLEFLQKYSKSLTKVYAFKDLSRLEEIFVNGIKLKEASYLKKTVKSAKSLFNPDFSFVHDMIEINYIYAISFLIIVVVNCIFYRLPFKILPTLVVAVNSLMLWQGFITYLTKLRNAEIENSYRLSQFDEECENQKWYQLITNLFTENKCTIFQKALVYNPMNEVFLLECVVDTYAFYIIRTPFKIIGSSVADFTGEVVGYMPWPLKFLVYVPISMFVLVIFLGYLLIAFGSHFRVSFFGYQLEFGKIQAAAPIPGPAMSMFHSRPPLVSTTRKPRGFIGSTYPGRLDLVTGEMRRRKNLQVVEEEDEPDSSNGEDKG